MINMSSSCTAALRLLCLYLSAHACDTYCHHHSVCHARHQDGVSPTTKPTLAVASMALGLAWTASVMQDTCVEVDDDDVDDHKQGITQVSFAHQRGSLLARYQHAVCVLVHVPVSYHDSGCVEHSCAFDTDPTPTTCTHHTCVVAFTCSTSSSSESSSEVSGACSASSSSETGACSSTLCDGW